MSIHSGPGGIASFGKAMEKRLAQVGITADAVHKVLWEGGEDDHFDTTDGGLSKKDLKRIGHPYARNGLSQRGITKNAKSVAGRTSIASGMKQVRGRSVAALPINRQTGKLRRSFFVIGPSGKDKTVQMGFRAPYAKYVLSPTGTQRMISRGFYSSGGKIGIIKKRHKLRLAVAKKVYRQSIKKV
jgi:hypothetical protein